MKIFLTSLNISSAAATNNKFGEILTNLLTVDAHLQKIDKAYYYF